MFGRKKKKKIEKIPFLGQLSQREIRAHYSDSSAASDLSNHFARARVGSADLHFSHSERERVRVNSRYEVHNNAYLKAMIGSYRNDLIGRCPRLQLHLGGLLRGLGSKDVRRISQETEILFATWAKECRLGRKLRAMVSARLVDGAALAQIRTNYNLPGPVKLDLKLLEIERLGNPRNYSVISNPEVIDGIEYDECDRPIRYYLYRYHPHDSHAQFENEGDWESAANIIHWYTLDRPEQHHGIGELQAGLVPASHSRRWRNATVKSAEAAASISGVVKTNAPVDPDADEIISCEAWDTIDAPHNSLLVLPEQWDLNQIRSEHPGGGFTDLHEQTVVEQGRSIGMHRAKSLGDASKYNYASVRYDSLDFEHRLLVDRDDVDFDLSRIFAHWWNEAVLIEGYLPNEIRSAIGPDDYPQTPPHEWVFDRKPPVDPSKEVNAAVERIKGGISNPAREIEAQGLDPETVLEQSARFFGVPVEEYQELLRQQYFDKGSNNGTEQEAAKGSGVKGQKGQDRSREGSAASRR